MLIRLEDNEKVIAETRSEALGEEIIVGRSRECQWHVVSTDGSVGRRHVSISRQGRHVIITDLESRNGTYVGSKRIKSVKLRPDMEVRFGQCIIRGVEDRKAGEADTAPRIHVVSGRARGTECTLGEGEFTVGSDPGASLVLMDDLLISREHAKVTFKDGGYWIRDCGSSNGTKVNSVLLRGDKERLLQDGDRIEIAHVELSYREKEGGRRSVWILVRLGVILATLLVIAGAYKVFHAVAPSAKDHVEQALKLASKGHFEAAREQLTKAETASGSDRFQLTLQTYRNSFMQWEQTQGLWQDAVTALEEGAWVDASRELAKAVAAPQGAWNWDPDGSGIDLRKEAQQAKRAVDAYLAVDRLQGQHDIDVEDARTCLELLAEVQSTLSKNCPAYLSALVADLAAGQTQVASLLEDFHKLDAAFKQLSQWPPPVDLTIAELARLEEKSTHARLRSRAGELLRPLRALSTSLTAYDQMVQDARGLDFDKALAEDPRLPSPDDCMVHSSISEARQAIKLHFEEAQRLIVGLSAIMRDVSRQEALAEDVFATGRHWRSADVMGRIMACDSLDSRYPTRTRKDPLGDYDRYLSVESFYEFLRSKGATARDVATSDVGFTPMIVQTYRMALQYQRLVNFMGPDKRWILGGKLQDALDRADAFLKARNVFVAEMVTQAGEKQGREAIISAGIALWLAEDPTALESGGKRLDDWLSQELRVLRTDISAKSGKYDFADAKEKIVLRKEVLAAGIPGDAIVKQMWIARSAVE